MLLEQGLDVGLELALGAAVHIHDVARHHVDGQGLGGEHRGNLDVVAGATHVDVAKISRPSGHKRIR